MIYKVQFVVGSAIFLFYGDICVKPNGL